MASVGPHDETALQRDLRTPGQHGFHVAAIGTSVTILVALGALTFGAGILGLNRLGASAAMLLLALGMTMIGLAILGTTPSIPLRLSPQP